MFSKTVLLVLVLICFTMAGCAAIDRALVPQYDEQGNEIGREPTELVQAAADAVPYGNVALNGLLLVLAGVAKFKQYKTEKGLKATVMAIKSAGQDPDLQESIDKLKESYLRQAHETSGATRLIKLLLAKL